jgi:hypothetical protein
MLNTTLLPGRKLATGNSLFISFGFFQLAV